MKLPPPTTLTDAEYVDNMRTVLNEALDRLGDHPVTLKRIRADELGIVLHSQGLGLIRHVDWVDAATEELMVEIEQELGGTPEHS